jgi:hypothetical protein
MELPPNLLDSLVAEFTDRLRRGESPTVEEYSSRHPELEPALSARLLTIRDCPDEAIHATQPRPAAPRLSRWQILAGLLIVCALVPAIVVAVRPPRPGPPKTVIEQPLKSNKNR